MGCTHVHDQEEYGTFMAAAKEFTKSKSVYQYQIAHFKILDIEKKIVPTAEQIQFIKIKKIMTSKRLADVRRVLTGIVSQTDEKNSIETLLSLQHSLENQLENKRKAYEKLEKEVNSFEKIQTKLKKLEIKRQNLKQRAQCNEMKLLKKDYSKRQSIQIINSPGPTGSKKNKRFSQFVVNQRLENVGRCLEKLSNMTDLSMKYQIDSCEGILQNLKSRIESLRKEKESILQMQNIDLTALASQSANSSILSEINNIKLQRIALSKENQALFELSKRISPKSS